MNFRKKSKTPSKIKTSKEKQNKWGDTENKRPNSLNNYSQKNNNVPKQNEQSP